MKDCNFRRYYEQSLETLNSPSSSSAPHPQQQQQQKHHYYSTHNQPSPQLCLENISLEVERGELIGVIG